MPAVEGTAAVVESEASLIERRHNVYAALSFVLLIACLGLPVWWISTRVYRAPIPYGDIDRFQESTLTLPVSITIVIGDDTVRALFRDYDVASKVKRAVGATEFRRMKISLDWNERETNSKERSTILSLTKLPSSSSAVERELDSILPPAEPKVESDGIEIYILHRPSATDRRVYFGSGVRIFVSGNWESGGGGGGSSGQEISDLLINVILDGYLRMDELTETVARHMKEEAVAYDKPPTTKLAVSGPAGGGGKSLSNAVLRPKVTLELNIVDPEPQPIVECARQFPIEKIMDDAVVIDRFLAKIKDVTDVTIKSQILYGIDFAHEPILDKRHGWYYFDPNQLQHIITPIETYLSTVVTTEPIYHMILYVPGSEYRPLKVVDKTLRPAAHNSFVVSGWGSVIVFNANRTCADKITKIDDDEAIKMAKKAVIANLRKYFGLRTTPAAGGGFERSSSSSPLSEWEIQSMRYRALVEYSFSSMRTLSSLTKLLGEITNIVINDQIGASIEAAVSEMNQVLQLKTNKSGGHSSVKAILQSATRAFEESEKAFFDPSLLALLYFPDDQKYAIYVPLFLPIGVPVVSSILFIYKHFRKVFVNKVKSD